MPGKKAHKPRNVANAQTTGVHQPAGASRKSAGQLNGGHLERDMRRKGQYSGAGDSPLIKK